MRLLVALVLALACAGCGGSGPESSGLPAGVTLIPGPVNGLILESGGERTAVYGDPREAPEPVAAVLFTHHRRDVAWAGRRLVEQGAEAVGPAAERALFEDVDAYWSEYATGRFHDYAQQSTKVLAEPIALARTVRAGAITLPGGLQAEVIETPGYTRGAVSYVFEIDGVRIAAVGDLIYGDGLIHDLFSLQDAIPEADTRGYHGYAARAADVLISLRKVLDARPDVLVPARGPVIRNPEEAAGKLIARIQELFRLYYTTDALRWYWGDDNLRTRARRVLSDSGVEWMEMARELREIPPRWLYKFGTSRLLVSDDRRAFLIDCGSDDILRQVTELGERGVFTGVDGIFVTHYHDDHTDAVQTAAERFGAPVYAGRIVADILERPGAYRMPAQTGPASAVAEVTALDEGHSWQWKEFTFTYGYFPGQAIYHGGLKAEREDGEKLYFVGDSFSPSGLDDYCLLNRHFLHPNLGHFLCLRKIREADPGFWLVNQHIEPVFRYAPEQLDLMEETLEGKRRVIAEMVPWEDPNFGSDEQWARLYPYGQTARAGEAIELWAVVFNHAAEPREFRIRPHAPAGWRAPAEVTLRVEPLEEGRVNFTVEAPESASGLEVVTADIAWGDEDLREWLEALVEFDLGAP